LTRSSPLKAEGYEEGKDFIFIFLHDPTAQHFEANWAKRFPNALMLVLSSIYVTSPFSAPEPNVPQSASLATRGY